MKARKLLLLILALPAISLPLCSLLYIVSHALQAWLAWTSQAEHTLLGQLWGSLALMFGAILLASPIAFAVALYQQLFANKQQQQAILWGLYSLQGIPPIVYGLCGLIVFVHQLHWGISLFSGQCILAFIIIPIVCVSIIHAFERIDPAQREAALSLGLSPWQMVHRLWLLSAWPAILTGLLMGMARSLAETAPIIFTATVFSGVFWPDSLFAPVTSLQTHIFYLAQEGQHDEARGMAWIAASLLITVIATLNITAYLISKHLHKDIQS